MEHSIPFLFNQPIYLELMQIRLAAHVENLLWLLQQGFYDSGPLFRTSVLSVHPNTTVSTPEPLP